MALSHNLIQKQSQHLMMTHELRQSIELLPLSNIELSEKIERELVENPMLEEGELITEKKTLRQDKPADFEQPLRNDISETKHRMIQNISFKESLKDHLLWQLRVSPLDEKAVQAGEIIISSLDENGFLRDSLESIVSGSSLLLSDAKRALNEIHFFDPVGCAASSIQESLIVQMRAHHPSSRAGLTLLQNHFEELENPNYRHIEKESALTKEEIEKALHLIRGLEPYPGRLYSSHTPEYVIPDLIVENIAGVPEVFVNDRWLPHLRVNEEYKQMIVRKGALKEEDYRYLTAKLDQAEWLIKSIARRRETLYRVTEAVVRHQEEWFLHGTGHVVPMTIRDIAEPLKLHDSTVSRISTNKYVLTDRGLFKLKYFFSGALPSKKGDTTESVKNIMERIRQMIKEESKESPLSDQDIADRIQNEGVQIARRTVAKYRKLLKILPAGRRKRIKRD